MNTNPIKLLGAIFASGFILAAAHAASDSPAPPPAAPTTLNEAISKGKLAFNLRTRYESVSQTNLKDSNALTTRLRFSFTTAELNGFKASAEFEGIASPFPDDYNQAGINPGGAGRAVVADPVGAEFNQFWLSYTSGKTTGTIGRQRIVYDNARFVGDVGWRQNAQSFDAFTLTDKSINKLTLNYAYLERINRIFGDKSPQGNWESESHLLNASYAASPAATITGYAYLIDITSAGFTANSCATYGVSLTGAQPVSKDVKLAYRAEYAAQSDYGSSLLNYSTNYYALELSAVTKPITFGAGYEVLGTDKNIGFKTPLATLHAFNGWADLFLATPGGGLRDTYVKVAAPLPGKFNLLAFYHDFSTDTGGDLGKEFDIQLTRKFGKYVTGLVKYAKFDRDVTSVANVKKVWVQIEFAY